MHGDAALCRHQLGVVPVCGCGGPKTGLPAVCAAQSSKEQGGSKDPLLGVMMSLQLWQLCCGLCGSQTAELPYVVGMCMPVALQACFRVYVKGLLSRVLVCDTTRRAILCCSWCRWCAMELSGIVMYCSGYKIG